MKLEVNRRNALLLVAVVAVVAVLAGRQYLGGGDQTGGRSLMPAIGGPFTLIDQTGKTVKNSDLEGRVLLIFFGYTFCPDVCPTALTIMAEALDLLGAKADDITPVFITVDPQRDTPEQLAMYVEYFHPRLVGLTGSPEQVAKVAKAYRVYYAKAGEDGADADDYLMEHTSITYLMDRDGTFRLHFSHGTDAETMAERIRGHL
ncbi:MAG: SCO family protein [Rhodospirillales bacterium]|jgi:protein SCO1/2|nr:SCO family protein [Rhodospirillales bacterium]HJO72729.1 SCO family protein [Rhodospirillales bacterium]